jgi:hypothetical protein
LGKTKPTYRIPRSTVGSKAWALYEVWEVAGLFERGVYVTGITKLEALFRTTVSDLTAGLVRLRYAVEETHAYLTVFCVEMVEAQLNRQGKRADRSAILEALRVEKDMLSMAGFGSMFTPTDEGLSRFPEAYDFEEALEVYSVITKSFGNWGTNGRSYFSTDGSYLGLGPKEMEEGDLVCVLFGSSTPHVIREDNGQYIPIGEAYVQGYMDGEAMAQLETGKLIVQDFAIK